MSPPRKVEKSILRFSQESRWADWTLTKYLQIVGGTIVRLNERTATVDAGDGNSWRMGFALLRRVLDI